MTHEKGARDQRSPNETRRAATTSISLPIITAQTNNPTADQVRWMRSFAQELDDRTLTTWGLRLEDVNPLENRRGYLWRELARLELRRRRRKGGAS